MATIEKSALLPYSSAALFELVNDIEAYPYYMSGCVGAQILLQQDDLIEARLDLSRSGVSQSFITRNRLQRPELIVMELVEGPFERLSGQWRFQALAEDACKVSLHLDFVLNSRLASLAVGKLFESVATQQVDAICIRAKSIFS